MRNGVGAIGVKCIPRSNFWNRTDGLFCFVVEWEEEVEADWHGSEEHWEVFDHMTLLIIIYPEMKRSL